MENTRDYILATAFRLFLEKGYKNTTMSQLVAASKVSKGAFYHYFASKEALFDAALETYFFALAAPIVAYEFDAQQHFRKNIQDYLTAKKAVAANIAKSLNLSFNSNYIQVLLEAMQLFSHHRERAAKLLDKELALYAAIFRQGQARGEIKPTLEVEILAKHFYFLLDGFELHVFVLHQLSPEKYAEVEHIIEQFCSLIEG
ncbi:TetR/AcrR family transcriptional regulator [Hugenholtzia roseola]|uniref:TetR/AcrR family transcriptional regulator n=1 Tax=Hugenholtzia roseola TaxID=1002 RepID=UPI0004299F7D|nr:TetR/AcrR family transcriptional regulator [Hugenholtzia roseola]